MSYNGRGVNMRSRIKKTLVALVALGVVAIAAAVVANHDSSKPPVVSARDSGWNGT